MTQINQLLPPGGPVDARAAFAGLRWQERAPSDRPFVAVNFVATIDGRAAVGGESGPASTPADRAIFHELRAHADAIMVGTGTLRVERYGRLAKNEELRDRREALGLAREPLGVVISRTLDFPLDIPLFQDEASRIVVYTCADHELPACPAAVDVRRLPWEETRPAPVLAALAAEFGVRAVLCEGGPTLFGAALGDGVIDELFLTVSPLVAGGGRAPTIASGAALPAPLPARLLGVLESEGALFLRYAVG